MSSGRRLLVTGVVVGAVAALVALAASAGADAGRDRAFAIDRFERTVTLRPDGVLDVVETIDVTFHEPRRGIFRDLESAGPTDDATYEVAGVDRGDAGSPWTYVEETLFTGGVRVRIGDADVELPPGPQRYRLTYTIDGLVFVPGHDPEVVQLRLDVPGDTWPTDVLATTLVVDLPDVATSVACVAGRAGATGPCPTAEVDGTRVTQDLPALGPNRTGTVAIELPRSAIDAASVPTVDVEELTTRELLAPVDVPVVPAALLLLGVLAAPALALEALRARFVYRDRVTDPALHDRPAPAALLEPPDGMPPVELAAVLGRRAGRDHLLATLVDLQLRGVVTTRGGQNGEPLTFGPGPSPMAVRPWEGAMLEALMPGMEPVSYAGTYDAGVARRTRAAEGVLSRHAGAVLGEGSRYVHRGGRALRGGGYAAFVVLVVLVGFVVGILGARLLGLPLVTLPVAWAGLGVAWLVLSRVWRHHRLPLSSEGRDAVARTTAFRSFLAEVHADQLEYAASRQDVATTHPSVALLPFAIAFGLADSWLGRFAPLMRAAAEAGRAGTTGTVDSWYLDRGAFAAATVAASRTTTAPSSSGSGGGGGGSFGGGGAGSGGGGGGGGSW